MFLGVAPRSRRRPPSEARFSTRCAATSALALAPASHPSPAPYASVSLPHCLSSPGGCFDRPDYSCRGRTIAVEVAASAQVCASLAAIDSSPSCFLFSIRLHLLYFGSHVLCTASVVFHSQSSLSHGTCWPHAQGRGRGRAPPVGR